MLLAGAGFGAVAAAIALCGEIFLPGRDGLALAALVGLSLLVVYSAPPVRVNDRGGGELVEAVGVGLLVPWISAYAQSGHASSPWFTWTLPGLFLLALSSAVASGLSDEESDRRAGKRTLTVALGNDFARRTAEYAAFAGLVAWMLAVRLSGGEFPIIPAQAALLAAALPWRDLTRESPHALTNRFKSQARYKTALHRLVWSATLVLALGLAAMRWLGWA